MRPLIQLLPPLFNQLIGGGVIRGIKLLSTSQVSQYDGKFRYVAEDPRIIGAALHDHCDPLQQHRVAGIDDQRLDSTDLFVVAAPLVCAIVAVPWQNP